MNPQLVYEIIGYGASLLIAISLMIKSLLRLRIINGLGALVFVIYGILIQAYPVAVLNLIIVVIDLFYFIKMLKRQDYFTLMKITPTSSYLQYFLSFHKKDIVNFFPNFKYDPQSEDLVFFILRDTIPAGVVIIRNHQNCGEILLDYALSDYRDFKIGGFLFDDNADILLNFGIKVLETKGSMLEHQKYLAQMGFEHIEEGLYRRKLFPHFISDKKI
jgi:hypothetical protein